MYGKSTLLMQTYSTFSCSYFFFFFFCEKRFLWKLSLLAGSSSHNPWQQMPQVMTLWFSITEMPYSQSPSTGQGNLGSLLAVWALLEEKLELWGMPRVAQGSRAVGSGRDQSFTGQLGERGVVIL